MTQRWHAEADRLRADGKSIRAIAIALGLGHGTVGEHFKPTLCECGRRRGRDYIRCKPCDNALRRWGHDRKVELVAGMYNDGWLCREIAEVLGRTVPTPRHAAAAIGPELHDARQRGLITDYRQAYKREAMAA